MAEIRSPRGTRQSIEWRGRSIGAWVPLPLAECELDVSADVARLTGEAAAALRAVDRNLPGGFEPLARLLLRTEGIASSSIEGVLAPVEDVLAAELGTTAAGDAGWIADNLAVVDAAIGEAHLALTVERLHGWHRRLMRYSRLAPELIGAFRKSPGWIGGTSPHDAAYVPPGPRHVSSLMGDLVVFANSDDLDPITHAAVVHGQFETIHPYGDGNGRLGRVLVGWVLRRRGVVGRIVPPISVLLARDAGGYVNGLYQFREGVFDEWVQWFARVVLRAADTIDELVSSVTDVLDRWTDAASPLRGDAAARRIIPQLPAHPIIGSRQAGVLSGVSQRTARDALETLVSLGVLEPVELPAGTTGRGRPPRWFVATDLLDAVRGWTH